MTSFVRAAGYAAGALSLAGSAAPAIALQLASAPAWALVGHAAAHIEGAALADKSISPAVEADFSSAALPLIALEEPRPLSLSELVSVHESAEVADSELECLAGAVYFESKGEPLEGQLAVAEVIMNRAGSGRYPSTYCGVVKQKSQFSFVRGGRIPAIPRASASWRKAVAIAHIAVKDLADSAVSDAMFFHARYVSPNWRGLKRVATVGNHIFYR